MNCTISYLTMMEKNRVEKIRMDKITIKNLEVFAHHGVLKEENVLGQKFLITVVIETDIRNAGRHDALEQTMDYAQVCHRITQCVTSKTYKLIEAVAEQVAQMILTSYEQAGTVTVEVAKPWAPIMLPLESVSVTVQRSWHTAYISLGSNMGDKKGHLENALALLQADEMTRIRKISSYYETAPVGGVVQEDFLNAAAEIETLRTPKELLLLISDIEKAGKRERTVHWGPRTIDLDILLYDNCIIDEEDLHIPHLEMTKRAFVLEPMNEIAPYAIHPVLGKRICELFDML